MSNLQQFVQQLQRDDELQQRLGKMSKGNQLVVALGAEEGYTFTEAEVREMITQQLAQNGQLTLSDRELEHAAGALGMAQGYTKTCFGLFTLVGCC